MKTVRHLGFLLLVLASTYLRGQEANSGIDLRATLTAQLTGSNQLTAEPRSGSPVIAGARTIAYPTLKFSEHWFATGAVQLVTRPYYTSDLSTEGYGAKGSVLQSTLNYSRVSRRGSLLVRGGEMSSAFGSFLLRYDDADNALIDLPPQYGYYYAPVSFLAVAAAQVDATRGKWDGRLQFANSSPANPRSIFAHDQYGNWAAGAGYTVHQGFRIGVSGYRGPYLDRKYAYYYPGEAKPSTLPAHAIGVDANWAHRHTSAYLEVQRLVMSYTLFPDFRDSAGYAELRQVLSPRWSIAGRYSLTSINVTGRTNIVETTGSYRPNCFQLLKFGYELRHASTGPERNNNIVAVQYITTFHKSAAL
jgi:hypothetical protein